MTMLAFIGFGEVGRTFARQLLANSGVQVAAYDLLFDNPQKRASRIAEAQAIGVKAAANPADACQDAPRRCAKPGRWCRTSDSIRLYA